MNNKRCSPSPDFSDSSCPLHSAEYHLSYIFKSPQEMLPLPYQNPLLEVLRSPVVFSLDSVVCEHSAERGHAFENEGARDELRKRSPVISEPLKFRAAIFQGE